MTARARSGIWAVTVATLTAGLAACGTDRLPGRAYEPRSGTDPVVVAVGDIACPGSPCPGQRDTAELVGRIDPDTVLVLGDIQYRVAGLVDFEASYDPTWGRFNAITHPVPGNHEYRSAGARGYFDYFGDAAHEDQGGWYSFDVGEWHLIAVNSGEGGISVDQLDWIESDLASDDHRCELAFWHHPRWTSGTEHGSDPEPDLRPLWHLLHDAGVDVAVNGHQHNYERFAPMDPDGRLDRGAGIRQLVAGTGGRSLFALGEPAPGSSERIDDAFGVVELTLGSDGYRWRFVSTAGRVLDSGRGECHG